MPIPTTYFLSSKNSQVSVMSDVNVDLLRRTLQYIEEHPERWDQSVWISEDGEKRCFVGTAVYLDGPDLEWECDDASYYSFVLAGEDDPPECRYVRDGREWVFCGSRAERVLGLTEDQVDCLSNGILSLDEIRALVAEFCGDA